MGSVLSACFSIGMICLWLSKKFWALQSVTYNGAGTWNWWIDSKGWFGLFSCRDSGRRIQTNGSLQMKISQRGEKHLLNSIYQRKLIHSHSLQNCRMARWPIYSSRCTRMRSRGCSTRTRSFTRSFRFIEEKILQASSYMFCVVGKEAARHGKQTDKVVLIPGRADEESSVPICSHGTIWWSGQEKEIAWARSTRTGQRS